MSRIWRAQVRIDLTNPIHDDIDVLDLDGASLEELEMRKRDDGAKSQFGGRWWYVEVEEDEDETIR